MEQGVTVMRWMLLLECGHNLATDEVPDLKTAELCPECNTYERITGAFSFRDDDIFARFESDGEPHPDDKHPRYVPSVNE